MMMRSPLQHLHRHWLSTTTTTELNLGSLAFFTQNTPGAFTWCIPGCSPHPTRKHTNTPFLQVARDEFPCENQQESPSLEWTESVVNYKGLGNNIHPASKDGSSLMESIHILGGGAMGTLLGGCIRTTFPSFPVSVFLRERHRHRLISDGSVVSNNSRRCDGLMMISITEGSSNKINSDGLLAASRQRRQRVVRCPAQIISDNNNQKPSRKIIRGEEYNEPIRNLIVTTKAMDAVPAIEAVLRRIDPSLTKIILLCNGALAVRDELILRRVVPETTSMHLGWTTHGAYMHRNEEHNIPSMTTVPGKNHSDLMYHVVHAGVGATAIEGCHDLAALLDRSGLKCRSSSSTLLRRTLWFKLAVSCTINPETALIMCRNGDLLDPGCESDFWSRTRQTLSEVVMVGNAVLEAERRDDEPATPITLEELMRFVNSVIVNTANNKSSMLQDIEAGRRTEVDYLNGYVVSKGRELLGMECPANLEYWERITELSMQSENRFPLSAEG